MTAPDLARLEALAEKATPGPWVVTQPNQCCNGACVTNEDGDGPIHDSAARYTELAFIAELRNAAASLLAAAQGAARVRALHAMGRATDTRRSPYCLECRRGPYPCPTIRALDGDDDA